MKTFQIVLSLPLCSGRGVRFRQLSPSDRDTVAGRAARQIDEDATKIDFRLAELREGVKAMLVAVTKNPVIATAPATAIDTEGPRDPHGGAGAKARARPAAEPDPLANENLWEPLNVERLSMPGPLSYDALFTPKDDDLLCKLYERYHEVTPKEVDAIVGKALEVSAA